MLSLFSGTTMSRHQAPWITLALLAPSLALAVPVNVNTLTVGNLASPSEIDTYELTVAPGTEVWMEAASSNNRSNMAWKIEDRWGRIILEDDGAFFNLGDMFLMGGTYTISVYAASGNYSFEVHEPTHQSFTASLGDRIQGTIDRPGTRHTYTFTAPANTELFLDSGPNSDNLRLSYTLLDPEGRTVVPYGGDIADTENIDLLGGEYTLIITSDQAATGDYDITLVSTTHDAATIAVETPFSGDIAMPGQTDVYTFSATGGQDYSFVTLSVDDINNTNYTLYDPAGEVVFGPTPNLLDYGSYTLTAGDHELHIDGEGDTVGAYQVRIDEAFDVTGTFTLGDTVAFDLDTVGERAFHTFTLASTTEVAFIDAGSPSPFDSGLSIVDANGMVIQSPTNSALWWGPQDLAAGTYTITYDPDGSHTGSMSYRVFDPTESSFAATLGDTLTAALTPGETHDYVFSAVAGQVLTVEQLSASNSVNMRFELTDALGRQVYNSTSLITTDALPLMGGTYTLRILGEGGEAGTYSVLLRDDGPTTWAPLGASFAVGTTVSDSIASSTIDYHNFTIAADTELFFDMIGNASGLRWDLYDDAGLPVWTNKSASSGGVDTQGPFIFGAGTYTLAFYHTNTGTPSYDFEVTEVIHQTTTASLNTSISGTITNKGSTHTYTITVPTAGVRFLDILDGDSDLGIRLTDPLGRVEHFSNSFASNFFDDFGPISMSPGDWTLTIVPRYDGTFNYDVRLSDVTHINDTFVIDDVVTGLNDEPGREITYDFVASAGQYVYFDLLDGASWGRWTLTDPMGNVRFNSKNASSSRFDDQGPYNLVAGTWQLTMDAINDEVIPYQFQANETEDNTYVAVLDVQATGAITLPGGSAIWTLDVPTATRVFFDINTTSNYVFWEIRDPTGHLIVDSAASADYFDDQGPFDLDAGTYNVRMFNTGGDTMPLAFTAHTVDDFARDVGFNIVYTDTLTGEGAVADYTFVVPDDGLLCHFDLLAGKTGTRWTLYDEVGQPVWNSESAIAETLDDFGPMPLALGTYTLRFDGDYDTVSTDYSFIINAMPAPDGICDIGEVNAIDCDTVCDALDHPDSTDCAGACGAIGDSDADGVCDDMDACEGFVDAFDADGDGIPDGCEPCGNGVLEPAEGETCDDGNLQPYDGCSNACILEIDTDGDGFVDDLETMVMGTDPTVPDLFECPGGRNPELVLPLDDGDTVVYAETKNMFLGSAVANIGDFDGDGNDDMAIGAFNDRLGGVHAGAVYIWFGPIPEGDLTPDSADFIAVGGIGDQAGYSVAGVGDVDQDGRDDLLIGSLARTSSSNPNGVAWLVYGTDTPALLIDLSMDADATFTGAGFNDQFGSHVSGVGDVDGDGSADFAIGAPYQDGVEIDEGAAYLYLDQSLGDVLPENASAQFLGETHAALAGSAITGPGDLDGDGIDDLVIGAPKDAISANRSGAIYIYYGSGLFSGTSSLGLADAILRGGLYDRVGSSLAAAGDINGDGKDDLWVGAAHVTAARRGAVYMVRGATDIIGDQLIEDVFQARLTGYDVADNFGYAVAGNFDANNDGHLDVLVGARHGDSLTQLDTGTAWVVLGPFGGSGPIPIDGARTGIQRRSFGGWSVATFPDMDGDGFGDALIGAWRTQTTVRRGGIASFFRGGTVPPENITWYLDEDQDTWGADGVTVATCVAPPSFVDRGGDCRDQDPNSYPFAMETDCGLAIDLDCDGYTGTVDNDGDGVQSCMGDCDDGDPTISSAAPELCDDGLDNNCDGLIDDASSDDAIIWYPDVDEDGYGDALLGIPGCDQPAGILSAVVLNGLDCNDLQSAINPEAAELCDTTDNDCDGVTDGADSLDAAAFWTDLDGDTSGDPDSVVRACSQPVGTSTNDLDCDDADDQIRPGATEACDTQDNDCDGMQYLGGPVALSGNSWATYSGEFTGDSTGEGITYVDDMDGDGRPELALGAPDSDLGADNGGAVYLRLSRTFGGDVDLAALLSGDTPTWDARITADRPRGRFGAAIAAGDLNGDGIGDLAIGAPAQARPAGSQGAVFLFFGPLAGDLDAESADVVLSGRSGNAQLGTSVHIADLDGDGYGDLLAGADEDDGSGVGAGAAYVIYGSASWLSGRIDAVADAEATGALDNALFGADVVSIGDADVDGFTDFAVSAPRDGGLQQGSVHIFYGSASRFSGSLTGVVMLSGGALDRAGLSLAAPGDVDGDGSDDLLVGSNDNEAWLLSGGTRWAAASAASQATTTIEGPVGSRTGAEVAAAGDVNGDGYADLLVASPRNDGPANDAGAIYLVYGGALPAILDGETLESEGRIVDLATISYHNTGGQHGAILQGQAGDRLGETLAAGADIDGDGDSDLLIASSHTGTAYQLRGGPYGLDQLPAVGTVGVWPDADGDGEGDSSATPGSVCLMHVPQDVSDTTSPIYLEVTDISGATDCDDTSAAVNTGADEICDSIDNDCDGTIDVAPVVGITYYLDADGDGLGTPTNTVIACSVPLGYVSNDDDLLDNAAPCGDADGDTCDDCSWGLEDPANDGPDADADGVCDAGDACPGDTDLDLDGVCDAVDPCPGSFSDDSDGDGVCDDIDPCPYDNPDDSDGDGVCDSDDYCDGSPSMPESTFVVDPDFKLIRRVSTPLAPSGAHFGVADNEIYALHRDTTTTLDGLFRLNGCTGWTKLFTYDNPAAIMPAPDGTIYVSEDFDGEVLRYDNGSSSLWVSGINPGDDDPVGMSFAPTGYTGPLLSAGEALFVDRGNNGVDGVWSFSLSTAQGEVAVHVDDGTLVNPVDLAISHDAIYVIDGGDLADGKLFSVGLGGALTEIPLSTALASPNGIAWDSLTETLLITDTATDKIWRVDPVSGVMSLFAEGFGDVSIWASIDVDQAGERVVVTTTTEVLVFGNCAPSLGDCDANGISDTCDLELHPERDCDANQQLDSCELAAGAPDCDSNGILDSCPSCSSLELVFVIDTSSSMVDEGQSLCSEFLAVKDNLASSGIQVQTRILSLNGSASPSFPCIQQSVDGLLGTDVPGTPAPEIEVFGACPGGNEVQSEDWGRGVAMVAGTYQWTPGSRRIIIPLFDEGAWCGDPLTADDTTALDHAILMAQTEDVVVYPITGDGTDAAVVSQADTLASSTGGTRFASTGSNSGLSSILQALSTDECNLLWDCNGSAAPDACEINDLLIDDCDGDGKPDSCSVVGLADGFDDGSCPIDGSCGDSDGDTCDDCVSFSFDPANDGPDFDGDGICDDGDTDANGDGQPDTVWTDGGFDGTQPTGDVDLVVVRERSYDSIDLSAYGMGTASYAQSIYLRQWDTADADEHTISGLITFPPSITVLGVITTEADLGGSSADGVLTASDAIFGLTTVDPDSYAGNNRGLEGSSDKGYVVDDQTVYFIFKTAVGTDDLRIIVSHGAGWQPDATFDVELYDMPFYLDGTPEAGIVIGDPLSGTPGNADYGEVFSVLDVPLASVSAGTSATALLPDPDADLYFITVSGKAQLWDADREAPVWGFQRNTSPANGRGILGSRDGYLYLLGETTSLARIDPITADTVYITMPPNGGIRRDLAQLAGTGDLLYIIRDTTTSSRVDTYLPALDVFTSNAFDLGGSSLLNPRGATDGADGRLWVVGQNGVLKAVDVGTGVVTEFAFSPPSGQYRGMTSRAGDDLLYAVRDTSGATVIDTFDVVTEAIVFDAYVLSTTSLTVPQGITFGADGMLYVKGDTAGFQRIDPATGAVEVLYWFTGSTYQDMTSFPAP